MTISKIINYMKVICFKKTSDISGTSSIKIFIDGKLVNKMNNALRFNVEFPDDKEKFEVYVKWQWCSSRKYIISVKDGMVLEIAENKFVDRKYRLMLIVPWMLIIVLLFTGYGSRLLQSLLLLCVGGLMLPMVYYITFGKNKYLEIREL